MPRASPPKQDHRPLPFRTCRIKVAAAANRNRALGRAARPHQVSARAREQEGSLRKREDRGAFLLGGEEHTQGGQRFLCRVGALLGGDQGGLPRERLQGLVLDRSPYEHDCEHSGRPPDLALRSRQSHPTAPGLLARNLPHLPQMAAVAFGAWQEDTDREGTVYHWLDSTKLPSTTGTRDLADWESGADGCETSEVSGGGLFVWTNLPDLVSCAGATKTA